MLDNSPKRAPRHRKGKKQLTRPAPDAGHGWGTIISDTVMSDFKRQYDTATGFELCCLGWFIAKKNKTYRTTLQLPQGSFF